MLKIHKLAIAGNEKELEKLLVDSKKDINSQATASLETPIFLACMYGHPLVVKLLLDNGANPYIPDNTGHIGLQDIIINLTIENPDAKLKENFYAIIEILLRYDMQLIEFKTKEYSFSSFYLAKKRPEVKERVLQIIKDIRPSHPLVVKEAQRKIQTGELLRTNVSERTSSIISQLRHRYLPEERRGRITPDIIKQKTSEQQALLSEDPKYV